MQASEESDFADVALCQAVAAVADAEASFLAKTGRFGMAHVVKVRAPFEVTRCAVRLVPVDVIDLQRGDVAIAGEEAMATRR
jgi:hypothetical protein